MTQDPHARDMPLSEVERLVMPAILLRQFHIRYAPAATPGAAPTGGETSEKGLSHSGPDGSDGALQPVGADLFAMVAKADAGAVIGSTTDGTAGRTACPQPWAPATIHGWRAGPVRRVVLTVGLQGGGVSRPAHNGSGKAMS